MRNKTHDAVNLLAALCLVTGAFSSGCESCQSKPKGQGTTQDLAAEEGEAEQKTSETQAAAALGKLMEPPDDAEELPNGWKSVVLRKGTSDVVIDSDDILTFHIVGWSKGREFINTKKVGKPVRSPLNALRMPGALEAFSVMKIGEVRRGWGKLAPGAPARPDWPRDDFMVDVELLDVKKVTPEVSQTVPVPDSIDPPDDAMRTSSGLTWSTIAFPPAAAREGASNLPRPSDTVLIDLVFWQSTGTSLIEGKRVRRRVSLATAPYCMAEVLLQMRPGERRRVWFPQEVARSLPLDMPRDIAQAEVEILEIPQ